MFFSVTSKNITFQIIKRILFSFICTHILTDYATLCSWFKNLSTKNITVTRLHFLCVLKHFIDTLLRKVVFFVIAFFQKCVPFYFHLTLKYSNIKKYMSDLQSSSDTTTTMQTTIYTVLNLMFFFY